MRAGCTGRDAVERATEYYYLALCALEDGDDAAARKNLREALRLLQSAGATHGVEYEKVLDKLTALEPRRLTAVA